MTKEVARESRPCAADPCGARSSGPIPEAARLRRIRPNLRDAGASSSPSHDLNAMWMVNLFLLMMMSSLLLVSDPHASRRRHAASPTLKPTPPPREAWGRQGHILQL